MLEIRDLTVFYGLHAAIRNVSLQVAPGEIVVVLGANGAGKSTLLRATMGMVRPASGHVLLDGLDLTSLVRRNLTAQVVEQGLVLVPERGGTFTDLTVRENLLLGAFPRRARAREQELMEFALSLFPRLKERWNQRVGTMSGGEQRMVAVARALLSAPRFLLLDEPTLGLAPVLAKQLLRVLPQIAAEGIGVLLVEQNAHLSLAVAQRGAVLSNGELVHAASAAELRDDPVVRAAYLGTQ
ncbi:ABC transporter ATP-binding protein [Thermomicrobium sp. CFH 73360]|uniref:ABC transporter ATP-binding protein n=1 Tax=Thermomicrobium sp. CFH 73360 TaxID=2951987 RepID=UPI002076B43E|nr:ABC transporter ATP-binding protein [Thermomicrobium sp. CFH 73360]MCM8745266.1 ABC transporter ATP-binding protein [Thermomicrobium sp. CFH 73360]